MSAKVHPETGPALAATADSGNPNADEPAELHGEDGKLESRGKKVIRIQKANTFSREHPLFKELSRWDTDNDGCFTVDEVMNVATELAKAEAVNEVQKKQLRIMLTGMMILLLFLILLGCMNAYAVYKVVRGAKDEAVQPENGIMMTMPPKEGGAQKNVATAALKVWTGGLAGLRWASKEELSRMEYVEFFHDGGYHVLKTSQVHRYDGRIEVWGCPFGFLVVEDTGEVHYSPFGTSSDATDSCWDPGASATASDPAVCGAAIDNLPPSSLTIQKTSLQEDPKDLPTPSPNSSVGGRRLLTDGNGTRWADEGEEVNETEECAEARRLSSRRRSGGTSRLGASRRRSGGTSSRRRASGGVVSSSTTSATSRRRSGAAGSAVAVSMAVANGDTTDFAVASVDAGAQVLIDQGMNPVLAYLLSGLGGLVCLCLIMGLLYLINK